MTSNLEKAPTKANSNASIQNQLDSLTNIWDCQYIEINGKNWTCLWCNEKKKGLNATRALTHVAGERFESTKKGVGVAHCRGSILPEYKQRYENLLLAKQNHIDSKKRSQHQLDFDIDFHVKSGASALHNTKRRAILSSPGAYFVTSESTPISELSDNTPTIAKKTSITKTPTIYSQQTINANTFECHSASHVDTLNYAIADMIHSHGLPFSLSDSPRLKLVLKLAKTVSTLYVPPSRNTVSGSLLKANFNKIQHDGRKELLNETAGIFGISIMGDGATIKKLPLFNILASGVSKPTFVLRVCDSTKHLEVGTGKHGRIIAAECIKVMKEIDPDRVLIDCLMFDGASNMVKAGKCVELIYPRITVIHGSEHVISLFCKDVLSIPPIRAVVEKYKFIYNVFGNGQRHIPYSLFSKRTKASNNGRSIGLIKAADTRMGGYWYCLHRMLRLHRSLLSTVTSPEWEQGVTFAGGRHGIRKKEAIEKLIMNKTFFEEARIIVSTLFPAIKVLRLSDSNKPGMDKLKYFVRSTTKMLRANLHKFNHVDMFVEETFPPADMNGDPLDIDADSDNESVDLDDDSVDSDNESAFENMTLGDQVFDLWNKRQDKLDHSFAIVGWILSVEPTIFADAASYTQSDYNVLQTVAKKILFRPGFSDIELDDLVNCCMEQFTYFRNKTGEYGRYPGIWRGTLCKDGQSHLWHQTHTSAYYKELGSVACRVTSKLLGIGSAERAWGDVKHLKNGQRSHLCHRTTEQASIVFGTACLDAARIKAKVTGEHFWGPNDLDDIDLNCELEKFAGTEIPLDIISKSDETVSPRDTLFLCKIANKVDRVFCAYKEKWEDKGIYISDDEVLYRYLAKYGGVRYINPDAKIAYVVLDSLAFMAEPNLCYKRKRWCLYGVKKGMSPNMDNVDKFDVVEINYNFFLQVMISNQDGIKVMQKNGKEVDRVKVMKKNFPSSEWGELSRDWESYD
jgi:hypothetical protein